MSTPDVDITHVPIDDVELAVRAAKTMGAKLVNMPIETIPNPVEPGSNRGYAELPVS